jgi:SAM-dependent methyltransferase
MNNNTQNIYDNPDFFEGYRKLRENPDNANILEEKPALFALAPDLQGKSVLDLGCGYGENCAEFLKMGAARVVGVDISEKMLAVAKAETSGITYLQADMNDLSAIEGQYDVVFSSLALHYIEDFDKLCRQVAALLNQGGYFIFSQEHPLTTSPINGVTWTRNEQGQRLHYNLTDYARSGRREMTWLIDGVVKYHRTFSDVVNGLTNAGFAVEKMLEPVPTPETLERLPYFADEYHKPNFLLIKARKG